MARISAASFISSPREYSPCRVMSGRAPTGMKPYSVGGAVSNDIECCHLFGATVPPSHKKFFLSNPTISYKTSLTRNIVSTLATPTNQNLPKRETVPKPARRHHSTIPPQTDPKQDAHTTLPANSRHKRNHPSTPPRKIPQQQQPTNQQNRTNDGNNPNKTDNPNINTLQPKPEHPDQHRNPHRQTTTRTQQQQDDQKHIQDKGERNQKLRETLTRTSRVFGNPHAAFK